MANRFSSLRQRWTAGLTRRIQQSLGVVEDYFFDIRYGTDTSDIIAVADLDISAQDKESSRRYQPTRTRYIRDLLGKLDLPENRVFVDFGSGKGRVLLVASNYGFDRLVGIEISRQLSDISRENVAIYQNTVGKSVPIEIIESNVLHYHIRDDENVFYFFRPFDAPVMREILDGIASSLMDVPRQVWVIICSSIYDELFAENATFQKHSEYTYGGAVFVVYTNH